MTSSDLSTRIQMEISKLFPLLVPTSPDYTSYQGFLEVEGALFRVSIVAPNYPYSTGVVFHSEWKLSELLSKDQDTLAKWERKEMLLDSFLQDLHGLIIRCLENGGNSRLDLEKDSIPFEEQLDNLQHYSAIISELKELGTANIESLSSDLRDIAIQYEDQNGEDHVMKVRISNDDTGKLSFEIIDTDLPEKIIKILQKEPNITKAYGAFCEQISVLNGLWSSFTLIDKNCWVLDPIHPRKADMYRRIFISPPSVMAQLTWDPLKPNQPPEIKFQGADAEIDTLRCIYEEHLEDWDQESNVLDNLCLVLQLTSLPQPPPPETNAVSQTVETGECSICYTVQLEGKLPEESCGKCLTSFHTECLYEWLKMMPDSRQVHGHLSGPCPNCNTIMKCPCPHALA
ncbi:E3 ubiquitin-protein ligase FANCL [Thrips palmi]|uniref:E3 ubiquitin-protein ligase FANCL n=1 Tax=Thrips palmi TaxID=161013 RepID=A0A6P8YEW4_THRPL|nr:E3 ubiquitin-protein ligase FANCL [Thrips palmi]